MYRGGKELFRIKVPSLPYDPTFLQKNRLGALPLRTPIRGRDFKGAAGGKTGFESYNSVFCQSQFTIGKLEQTSSDTKIVIFTINEFYVVKRVFGVLRGFTPKQSGKRERVLGRERKPQSDGVSSLSLIKQRILKGIPPLEKQLLGGFYG